VKFSARELCAADVSSGQEPFEDHKKGGKLNIIGGFNPFG
jgi:hypothetical protein